MKTFHELQEDHIELLRKQEDATAIEIVDSAKEFIDEAIESSVEIESVQQREQLRADLRYWASIILDLSGEYPAIELEEPENFDYSGLTGRRRLSRVSWGVGLLLLTILIVVALAGNLIIGGFNSGPVPSETPEASPTSFATSTGVPATLTVEGGLPSATPDTATATPDPAAEPDAQLTSHSDFDEVSPIELLSGDYSNLSPGVHSIHALVQPRSKGTKYFPNEEFFFAETSAGSWSLLSRFGNDDEIGTTEEYKILVAIARDDQARSDLKSGFESGFEFDDLPRGVKPIKRLTTVTRQPYVHLQEDRILYAGFSEETRSNEIVVARLDGSDPRALTRTTLSEQEPNLCAASQKIAFIGHESVGEGVTEQTLQMMDSDGRNAVVLSEGERFRFERPIWSPDCRFLAYTELASATSAWEISLLEFSEQGQVIKEHIIGPGRYQSWFPESSGHQLAFTGANGFIASVDLEACGVLTDTQQRICDPSYEEIGRVQPGAQPAISPDGSLLAFASVPRADQEPGTFNQDIMLLSLVVGGDAVRLTEQIGQDWYPAWLGDGETLVFESSRDDDEAGNAQIWSINANGTGLRRLTPGPGSKTRPSVGFLDAYLPDG